MVYVNKSYTVPSSRNTNVQLHLPRQSHKLHIWKAHTLRAQPMHRNLQQLWEAAGNLHYHDSCSHLQELAGTNDFTTGHNSQMQQTLY